MPICFLASLITHTIFSWITEKQLISHNVPDGYSTEQPSFQFSRHRLEFLICRNTVSIDIAASDCVLSLLAGVAWVALYGINCAILTLLYDTNVVCCTVAFPIKEDNISYLWFISAVLPFSIWLKPVCTIHATCKFRNKSAFNIPALVSTPRYEAGTDC